jgi:hypothetical protein
MGVNERIALVSALISAVSLVVAGFSWWNAKRVAERADLSDRVKVFVELRAGFHDIRKNLRRLELDGAELPTPDTPNWDTHELYWHHAFTEWYVTTKLHPEMRRLWDEFFSLALQETLTTHRPLRYVAWSMVEQRRPVFGVHHAEFRSELERLNHGALGDGSFRPPVAAVRAHRQAVAQSSSEATTA